LLAFGSVTIVAASLAVIDGQTPRVEFPDQWLSIRSSPLEVLFSPSQRDIQLLNRSSEQVVRYRLGCVKKTPAGLKTLHRLSALNTSLEPNKVLLNSAAIYSEDLQRCSKKEGKLAVVEVIFIDGSAWKLK
jgi:hypothetical protein